MISFHTHDTGEHPCVRLSEYLWAGAALVCVVVAHAGAKEISYGRCCHMTNFQHIELVPYVKHGTWQKVMNLYISLCKPKMKHTIAILTHNLERAPYLTGAEIAGLGLVPALVSVSITPSVVACEVLDPLLLSWPGNQECIALMHSPVLWCTNYFVASRVGCCWWRL